MIVILKKERRIMLYEFRQNNSGGSFTGPAEIVFVEADSADEANNIALLNGLYFGGVRNGRDCPCCGDRWYPVCDGDQIDVENFPQYPNRSVVFVRKKGVQ
jgi:hypothetical protein